MQSLIDGFDREKGRLHNLDTVIKFSRALSQHKVLCHSWQEYWGLCFCYDALIGNTDRHQENWGVIWNDKIGTARLTPFFDNGTSLGHELFEKKIRQFSTDQNGLRAYIRKGRHPMKWSLSEDGRPPLIEGVYRICVKYPAIIPLLVDSLGIFQGSCTCMSGVCHNRWSMRVMSKQAKVIETEYPITEPTIWPEWL